MRLYKIIIILTLILCSTRVAWCQEQKEYLYVDSALLDPPLVDTASSQITQDSKENMGYEAEDNYQEKKIFALDTNLVNNELVLSYDSVLALKNAKQFRYAKSMDSLLKALQEEQQKKQKAPTTDSPSLLEKILSAGVTKIIFWALAVFFVLFIISKLFITQGFFQRNSTRTPVTVQADEEKEPVTSQEFERKAMEAAASGNYRLATRYLYLQTLHLLADAGVTTLTSDKTNAQYVYELAGKPYSEKFASLTLNYEYIWYGEFAIDNNFFEKLNQQFKAFNNELKKT